MKLASFEIPTATGPVRRVGVLDEEGDLIDVRAGYKHLLAESGDPDPGPTAAAVVPTEMAEFLSRGERAMAVARDVRAATADITPSSGARGPQLRFEHDEVTLLSPLPRPNSIRAFSVFEEHLQATFPHELPDVWYDVPIYWKGNPDTVVGPGDEMTFPPDATQRDFEIEICAIVGSHGRDIDVDDASEYIAGYTIHNDWSERAIQMQEMEMSLGPSMGKDFANGFGPYLVTADEFDLEGAAYSVAVNGEVWTNRKLGEMQHSFAEMISEVSRSQPILPGDAIVTGTLPGGCGLEHDRFITPGDSVELSVDGLGSLRNTVAEL